MATISHVIGMVGNILDKLYLPKNTGVNLINLCKSQADDYYDRTGIEYGTTNPNYIKGYLAKNLSTDGYDNALMIRMIEGDNIVKIFIEHTDVNFYETMEVSQESLSDNSIEEQLYEKVWRVANNKL